MRCQNCDIVTSDANRPPTLALPSRTGDCGRSCRKRETPRRCTPARRHSLLRSTSHYSFIPCKKIQAVRPHRVPYVAPATRRVTGVTLQHLARTCYAGAGPFRTRMLASESLANSRPRSYDVLMEDDDPFPQALAPSQVRFEIVRGFQQIPRSVLRSMLVKDYEKAARAQEAAITTVAARFDGLQVRAPAPLKNPMDGIGNNRVGGS